MLHIIFIIEARSFISNNEFCENECILKLTESIFAGASPVRRDFGRGFTGKMIFLAYFCLKGSNLCSKFR